MSTQAAGSPTLALAGFAARLRFADLPAAVVRQAQRLVLDALGCGLYGSSLEPSEHLRAMLLAEGGPGGITLWGRPERLPLLDAVLANGTAVTAARVDDTHREAMIHGGAVLVPTCLALAERRGPVDGRALLTAIVAGCEVGTRVGLAAGIGMMRRGFEPAAYSGTFCAAAAAGR
ncbi:MAG: MmgE/PrpD family protein, partial [Chloroflexi bacterium]|nr:MmgE/PrpD family protein [Chloroflexota bacterium]